MKAKDIISKQQKILNQFKLMSLMLKKIHGGKVIRRLKIYKNRQRNILIHRGFMPWDRDELTKMEARILIKWFLGHKHDGNKLPFSTQKRNQIRTKKELRNTIVRGLTDNLYAVKLLDDYGLLDKRNARRKRKTHLKSRWTDTQIVEEFFGPIFDSDLRLVYGKKRVAGKIRTLLRKIERLEARLGIKRKRRRYEYKR